MKQISILQIGEICGVSRSTVSYWISRKSLPASRVGKKHMVLVDDLIHFLRAEGRPAPPLLEEMNDGGHTLPFISFKNCWEYWAKKAHGANCSNCGVFTHQITPCFAARDNHARLCPHDCHECGYYDEYCAPQTSFINQIDKPAAVFQDLFFWAGNRAWADLCGVETKFIPGLGIEEILHPASLKQFLGVFKRIVQGDAAASNVHEVLLNDENNESGAICLSVVPLKKPESALLLLADSTDNFHKQKK